MLASLNSRERLLAMVALPVVLLAALYRFGWMPLQEARAETTETIAGYRQIIAAASALPPPGSDAPRATPSANGPLSSRVTQSADGAGLTLRRLEPEGSRIRVSLEDTPFEALLSWIAAMEREDSVRVVAAELSRRPEPGIVTARVTLEDAP